MITIEPCPCPYANCSDYHLVGIGKFVQGSGFSKEEAQKIADLLNGQSDYYVLIESYATYVKDAHFFKEQGGLRENWGSRWEPIKAKDLVEAREIAKKMQVERFGENPHRHYNSEAPGQ